MKQRWSLRSTYDTIKSDLRGFVQMGHVVPTEVRSQHIFWIKTAWQNLDLSDDHCNQVNILMLTRSTEKHPENKRFDHQEHGDRSQYQSHLIFFQHGESDSIRKNKVMHKDHFLSEMRERIGEGQEEEGVMEKRIWAKWIVCRCFSRIKLGWFPKMLRLTSVVGVLCLLCLVGVVIMFLLIKMSMMRRKTFLSLRRIRVQKIAAWSLLLDPLKHYQEGNYLW